VMAGCPHSGSKAVNGHLFLVSSRRLTVTAKKSQQAAAQRGPHWLMNPVSQHDSLSMTEKL